MQLVEANHQSAPSGVRARTAVGVAVLAVPLLLYTLATTYTSVNIPIQDDYDAIGVFLENYSKLHGFAARAWFVLTSQHVQYKLMFLHTVVAIQYELIGHTNYRVLQLMGDLAIPATVWLLWLFLARSDRPIEQRIWLFVTPCYLFFAIRYLETVNWAMSGLQNMAIVPISVATFYFATSTSRRSTLWTALFLIWSIATSGNGFFVAAVLIFMFLLDRRYREAAWTLILTVGMAALYAVHYHSVTPYPPLPLREAVKALVLFPFAFLGNCAASVHEAALLGACLLVGFIFLTRRGWRRVCPGSFSAALFCLVTAAGVTATRYRAGTEAALAQRYAMYSLLLIALEYIAVVRLLVPSSFSRRSRSAIALTVAALLSIYICLISDAKSYRNLHARQRALITHLILWQRHPDHLVLAPDEESWVRTPEWVRHRIGFQADLQREISAGLYIPPYSASSPLPVRPHSPATLGIEDEPPPSR